MIDEKEATQIVNHFCKGKVKLELDNNEPEGIFISKPEPTIIISKNWNIAGLLHEITHAILFLENRTDRLHDGVFADRFTKIVEEYMDCSKFRVWSNEGKYYCSGIDSFAITDDNKYLLLKKHNANDYVYEEVDTSKYQIEFCTGLKDSQNNLIFENDVLTHFDTNTAETTNYLVYKSPVTFNWMLKDINTHEIKDIYPLILSLTKEGTIHNTNSF